MSKYDYLSRNCGSIVKYELTMDEVLVILKDVVSTQSPDMKDYMGHLENYVSIESLRMADMAKAMGCSTDYLRLLLRRLCWKLDEAIIAKHNNYPYEDTVYSLNISKRLLYSLLRNGYVRISVLMDDYWSGALRKSRYIGNATILELERQLVERGYVPADKTRYCRRR